MTETGSDHLDNEARVVALQWEADGICSVTFATLDGSPLPPWKPGAHVDVTLPNKLRRQYSLISDPHDLRTYRLCVARNVESRGGSEYVHAFLRPGQTVRLGLPRNHFALAGTESHWVFVAGGIGITPFLPMVTWARAHGVSYELHYGARRRASMALLQELGAGADDRIVVRVDEEDDPLDLGHVVTSAPSGAGIYACGPAPMLDVIAKLVGEREDVQLHVERFEPRPKVLSTPRPFSVLASRSGVSLDVASNRSLLQSLEAAGIRLPSGCRSGICGACEVPVIQGAVDHRDDVLTEQQRERSKVMMACVSRAADESLVLDV